MTEQRVSFDTALTIREIGFIGYKSNMHYRISDRSLINGLIEDYTDHNLTENYLSAPSQSVVQQWLREVYNIHIVVWWYDVQDKFYYQIGFKKDNVVKVQSGDISQLYDTYECALELGLQEALRLIVKNKTNEKI